MAYFWEARIIRQLLYDTGSVSAKFIPVLFSDGSADYIATPVRGAARHVVDTEAGYEALCRQVTKQPGVIRPPLGKRKALPPKQPKSEAAAAARSARRDVPVFRIFLSSPGDVAEERAQARQLIDSELPKLPHLREQLKLELIAWDDPAARIPMLATETPQQSVNAARPRPAACDIVIVILWARMGTPLPDDHPQAERRAYLSGTEWEYEDAINSPRQPSPDVLVYRRTEEPMIRMRDPEKREKEEQFERTEAFFAQLRAQKRGVNEYATPNDFKPLLRQHLEDILYRRLRPSDGPGEARPASAVIPAEYYAWLRRSFEKVELLGAKEGRAVTLNHVYVPALTRPAPALARKRARRRKATGGGGRTEVDPAPAAPRPAIPLRPSTGGRRQVHLLPLGGVAEHPRRRHRASAPGAGRLHRAVAGKLARPSAAAGPAAGVLAEYGLRSRRTRLAPHRSGEGARRLGRPLAAAWA